MLLQNLHKIKEETLPFLCINWLSSLSALFFADSDGSIPLWEAISGRHESVTKLLIDNGAEISSGDVGNYACTAAEHNDLELLKDIVQYGGNVTLPISNGTTALHTAVCEGSTEIAKFLLDQGADIDRPDINGWTPRTLADHQGHEDIKDLFQSKKEEIKKPSAIPPLRKKPDMSFLGKYQSEPTMLPYVLESLPATQEATWSDSRPRRRANNFCNSLFGVMSAANAGEFAS